MNNGQMKTGQSVDRSKIPEESLALFAYRERAKGFIDGYLEALYPNAGQISAARAEALDRSIQPSKPIELITKLVSGRFRKVTMFSDLGDTSFYFIEHLTTIAIIRRSITYNNRDRALLHFQDNTLKWKEVIELNDVE